MIYVFGGNSQQSESFIRYMRFNVDVCTARSVCSAASIMNIRSDKEPIIYMVGDFYNHRDYWEARDFCEHYKQVRDLRVIHVSDWG